MIQTSPLRLCVVSIDVVIPDAPHRCLVDLPSRRMARDIERHIAVVEETLQCLISETVKCLSEAARYPGSSQTGTSRMTLKRLWYLFLERL